jgi:hypothetical protein
MFIAFILVSAEEFFHEASGAVERTIKGASLH